MLLALENHLDVLARAGVGDVGGDDDGLRVLGGPAAADLAVAGVVFRQGEQVLGGVALPMAGGLPQIPGADFHVDLRNEEVEAARLVRFRPARPVLDGPVRNLHQPDLALRADGELVEAALLPDEGANQ